MAIDLRKSTASQEIPLGYFVDSTDGNTAEIGLTIANTDIKIWKTGATTLADKNSDGATHISNGIYYATLDATDTNTIGPMVIFVKVSGALGVRVECNVLDEAVYDVKYGTTAPATATNITAGTITTATNVTTVNGLAANVITAAATASDFGTEVGTAVWATAARTLTAATNITSTGGSVPITAGGLVSSDVTAISTDTTAANNAESFFDGTGYAGTNNVIPTVTTVTNLTNAPTAGDFTATMKTSIGTAVAASAVASVTGNVGGNVVGSVGSVTAGVTVTTNNDKTGYALSAAGVDAIWDEATAGHVTAGSYGVAITDILADTAEIGTAGAGLTNINLPDQTMNITGNITGNLSGSVGSVTGAVGSVTGNVGGSVASIATGGIAAASFAAGAIDAAAIATDAIGSNELAASAIAEIQSGLSNLSQADIRTAIGLASANLDTQLAALPTAAENADAVWEEAIADHSGTAGSTAEALGAAGSAGDPWSTALPGAYGAGTAGKIIGDNINATISSRASQTSVDDLPTNAELATALAGADDAVLAAVATVDTVVDAIKAKTDSLTFTVAGQVDSNIQYVNDVQVNGNGQTGSEWGP